jgi:hypothetical protein
VEQSKELDVHALFDILDREYEVDAFFIADTANADYLYVRDGYQLPSETGERERKGKRREVTRVDGDDVEMTILGDTTARAIEIAFKKLKNDINALIEENEEHFLKEVAMVRAKYNRRLRANVKQQLQKTFLHFRAPTSGHKVTKKSV